MPSASRSPSCTRVASSRSALRPSSRPTWVLARRSTTCSSASREAPSTKEERTVRSRERAELPSGSDDGLAAVTRFARDVGAVAEVEIRKLLRDPTEVFTRSVQPTLWLVVFGQVFARTRAIPTGSMGYLDFMTPGVLAQSVLFTAIFYGIAIIWERDLGILQKMLVTPAYRGALVLGKAASAGARAVAQTVIIYVIAVA